MEYEVTWVIQVDAKNPREAAKAAKEIQQDPFTTATNYQVRNEETGEKTVVDLEEGEET